MSAALVPFAPPLPALPVVFQEAIAARTAELRAKSKSASTRRAYANDWKQFLSWCFMAEVSSLPATAATVEAYLTSMTLAETPRGKKYSVQTIQRRLASISHFHKASGAPDPTQAEAVKTVMEGIRRDNAGRPSGAKGAILTKHLRKGLKTAPQKPADFRNRALVLVAFAAALRRSELVAIDVEHLTFDDEGRVRIHIPKSKTDQTGEGQSVWILPGGSHCPVKALRAWLEVGGISSGAVFRSVDRHKNVKGRICAELVPYVVKRFAKAAGLDPAQFSGHSLRAGHVTQAFLNETPAHLIQRQGRWKSIETVMRYNREVDAATHNSSAHLGL
jgi:integrase